MYFLGFWVTLMQPVQYFFLVTGWFLCTLLLFLPILFQNVFLFGFNSDRSSITELFLLFPGTIFICVDIFFIFFNKQVSAIANFLFHSVFVNKFLTNLEKSEKIGRKLRNCVKKSINFARLFKLGGNPCLSFSFLRNLHLVLGIKSTKYDNYFYLSDGGHVDNIAIIPLFSKKCTSIFVFDSGHDPKTSCRFVKNHILSCLS